MKAPAYDTEPLSESFIGQSLPTIKKGKNRLKKGKCLNGTLRAKSALAGQFWQLKINATSAILCHGHFQMHPIEPIPGVLHHSSARDSRVIPSHAYLQLACKKKKIFEGGKKKVISM